MEAIESLYSLIEIPEHRRKTSPSKKEAEFMYNFIKEKGLGKTLETGFAYGLSTVYIISASQSKHYAIDPFQDGYDNFGVKNVNKFGLERYLSFEPDFSHNVLPKLLKDGVRIDFAFMDGGHKFDTIMVDFYFIDLLLEENGYVLIHDTWMRSTATLVSWIKNNKPNFEHIKTPFETFALFRKTGKDTRPWYHFKNFRTWSEFSMIEQFWFEHFNKSYHNNQK